MVDIICGSLIVAPCVTDFWTFWGILLAAIVAPFMMFIMLYILPGPTIVGAFLKAKLSGSPVIFKARRDMRTDIIVGEYKSGVIFSGKREGFIPQQDSFYILPGGFRWAGANEMYGTTLPHQLVKDIANFKDMGFRTMQEVEDYLTKREKEMLAMVGGDLSKLPKEQREVLEKLKKQGEYVTYLREKEEEHKKMFLPFSRINNFFKNNINPSYIRSAIEEAVSEALTGQRKMDINKIIMVVIIMSFVAVIILAIVSSLDLSGSGGAPAVAIPNPVNIIGGGIGVQ